MTEQQDDAEQLPDVRNDEVVDTTTTTTTETTTETPAAPSEGGDQ